MKAVHMWLALAVFTYVFCLLGSVFFSLLLCIRPLVPGVPHGGVSEMLCSWCLTVSHVGKLLF
jgi:hypothetical protein